MTKREAAIVSAYTGILIGEFADLYSYIEELMGRPVFAHEMGYKAVYDEISERAKPDFVAIEVK